MLIYLTQYEYDGTFFYLTCLIKKKLCTFKLYSRKKLKNDKNIKKIFQMKILLDIL